jgi:glycosyltransferase involved in cell wall biosynthesis
MDQIKTVHELHGLMRHVMRNVSAVVALSPGLAEKLSEFGAANGNVIHFLRGVPPETIIRPTKVICEFLRFGYIGGSDPVNGLSTILAALELLPIGLPLAIRVIGGDSLRRIVQRQPAKVRGYIQYHTPLFGRAKMEEHARIDAMLVPSLWHESSPLVAQESLANGTPVLGADQTGISHLIVPDRNGWLIKPGSPTAWARAFIRAVEQPARIRAMQLNATFTRTTQDFVNDLEWVENPLLGRANRREEFRPTPPVAIYA